jgi:hypothetical protein
MGNRLQQVGCTALGLAVAALGFVATCVNFGSGPTDQTPYYIDENNVFYSPPLMERDQRNFAFAMLAADAIADGFQPLDLAVAKATNPDGMVFTNPKSMKWVVRQDPRGHILVSVITRAEFPEIKPKADPEHREVGGFQDWCGLFGWIMRKAGVGKPRFGSNGEWNW